MAAAPIVFGLRCAYCSQFKPPHDVIEVPLEGGARIHRCLACEAKRLKAQQDLAKNPRFHCDECAADLRPNPLAPDGLGAYWEPKDGTWALLCERCSWPYEQKRRDLFKGTPHGWRTGITK